jgi:crotonobetainyl-CoA:carnitine CoA-transferase CaiB-like acyl-CoA transferase
MYQLGPAVLPEALLSVQVTGQELQRIGNEDLDALISGLFPARGPDRWLAVSIANPAQLSAAADIVDGLAGSLGPDGRLDLDASVSAHQAISVWSTDRDPQAAATELQRVGVAAAVVYNSRDLLTDEGLRDRALYEWVDIGPGVGRRPLVGRPYTWHSPVSVVGIAAKAPAFAEHNSAVFNDLLKMPTTELADLQQTRTVVDDPINPPPPPAPVDFTNEVRDGLLAAHDPDYRTTLAKRDPAHSGRTTIKLK